MSSSSNSRGGGIGFVGLLQLAFIVLKLAGVIAWSWVWVLAPTWIMAAIVVCVLIGVAFLYWRDRRRGRRKQRRVHSDLLGGAGS